MGEGFHLDCRCKNNSACKLFLKLFRIDDCGLTQVK